MRNRMGFLPGNHCVANNAMILAGQKGQQCVEANLFLYDISERANPELINLFDFRDHWQDPVMSLLTG